MALVQDDVGTVADGGTLVFGSNVAAGSMLGAVIAVSDLDNSYAVTGITDTRGNTWALARREASLTNAQVVEIWYAWNPNAGANTLTFDWNEANSAQVLIYEFDSFPNGVSIDQQNGNSATAAATFNYGSITTTQAVGVSIAGGRITNAFNATLEALGDSFVALTYGTRQFSHYKVLSGTETHDCDVNFNGADTEAASGAIVNFYDPGAGGASPHRRVNRMTLLGVH